MLIKTVRNFYNFCNNWHKDERLTAFVSTHAGRVALTLAAILLLGLGHAKIAPFLVLFLMFPQKRNLILSLGSLVYIYKRIFIEVDYSGLLSSFSALLVLMVLVYSVYLAARNFPKLPKLVRRYPKLVLHGIILGILSFCFLKPGILGDVKLTRFLTILLPFLAWRCGYLLISGKRGQLQKSGFIDHFFYIWPIYGGSNVPYGKGHDYLSQNASKNLEDLAGTQISGIKLLILWRILQVCEAYFCSFFYMKYSRLVPEWLHEFSLKNPELGEMLPHYGDFPVSTAWFAIFLSLVNLTLSWAINGHVIIAVLRLFGFRVFRNTYKPLLSQSIVEFWNRYYYYFKELLVEFFFFPAYLSFNKFKLNIRLLIATFAAAFWGNLYYHILRDSRFLVRMNLEQVWNFLASRTLYCLLLATGIYISMLREQKRRGQTFEAQTFQGRLYQARRIGGVLTFFALIHIWSISTDAAFIQRTTFFFSLFGF